jgi:hypothetical protein
MMYLLNEALLRLIKPAAALLLAFLLYWLITGPLGEAGSALLFLACWMSTSAFILLVETGVI